MGDAMKHKHKSFYDYEEETRFQKAKRSVWHHKWNIAKVLGVLLLVLQVISQSYELAASQKTLRENHSASWKAIRDLQIDDAMLKQRLEYDEQRIKLLEDEPRG